jgi:hypothetical protein
MTELEITQLLLTAREFRFPWRPAMDRDGPETPVSPGGRVHTRCWTSAPNRMKERDGFQ